LAAAGRIHFSTWSGRFFQNPVDSFFPGFTVIALAVFALALASRDPAPTRRRIVMMAVIAAAGAVLSLGTATPVYGWLFHAFPPMPGLRAARRCGNPLPLCM